jgi:hypothetical protein
MPLTDKEAAALARLEAEKKRRIEDKIQSGAAIRVPLPIIAGASESVDVVKACKLKLEQLRRNGEAREVFFDAAVIITGVPRFLREPENYKPPISSEPPAPSIFDRRSAPGAPSFAVSEPQARTPDKQIGRAESPVVHHVRVTVRPPTENDPGAIVEGQYRIVNGNLEVTDLQGRSLGTQSINAGDDAEAAARAVLRKKRGRGFNDPIVYPRRSIH